jgi:hypothetical protein
MALQNRDRDGARAPDQRSITSRFALGAAAHPGHEMLSSRNEWK